MKKLLLTHFKEKDDLPISYFLVKTTVWRLDNDIRIVFRIFTMNEVLTLIKSFNTWSLSSYLVVLVNDKIKAPVVTFN